MNNLSHQVDYLFETMFRKYPDLINEIRLRQYTVSDTGFTSRNINTLAEDNLIPELRKSKTEWRKFNLNDLLYFHVIEHCRKFNMDNSQLKKLQSPFYNEKTNYVVIGEVTPTEEALVVMLTNSVPMSLKIYSDGTSILSDNNKLDLNDLTGSSIFIDIFTSFSNQLNDFKKRNSINRKYDLSTFEDGYRLNALKPHENKILNLLKQEEFSKIVIIKKPNGDLDVDGEKVDNCGVITPEDFSNLIKEVKYGKIEVTTEDSNPQSIKVNRKYKIKTS